MQGPWVTSLLIVGFLITSCEKPKEETCDDTSDSVATTCIDSTSTDDDPTAQDLGPTPGEGPTFTSITSTSITMRWTAGSDAHTDTTKLEYQLISASASTAIDSLEEAQAISGVDVSLAWAANTLTHTVSGLTPSQTIAYNVLVRDEVGNVSIYTAQTVTTIAADAPTPGAAITFSNISASGFTASWGSAASTVTSASNLEYKVVLATSLAAVDTLAEVINMSGSSVLSDWSKNILGIPVSAVNSGTVYALAVLVRDERGAISMYSPALVTTLRHRLIFMTTSGYMPAQLSPASAADALCNDSKPSGRGTFKAMIASSDRRACTTSDCAMNGALENSDWVMAANTSYENASGQILWTTNAAGIVPQNPTHPAIYAAAGNGIAVWTGIASGWRNSSDNCQNWTSSSNTDYGFVGIANYTDSSAWTFLQIPCNQSKSIYCVEQ